MVFFFCFVYEVSVCLWGCEVKVNLGVLFVGFERKRLIFGVGFCGFYFLFKGISLFF